MAEAGILRRPESVLVVVCTLQGQVLLLQRKRPAGVWQSVTGSLEANETPVLCAIRELREETGLTEVPVEDCFLRHRFRIHTAWAHRYEADVTHNVEHAFLAVLPDVVSVTPNPAEHSDFQWLPARQAVPQIWSSTNRDVILQRVVPRFGRSGDAGRA